MVDVNAIDYNTDINETDKQNGSQDPIIKESQITIVMDVNIPGQTENQTFTSEMLKGETFSKNGFSEYPFFTVEIEYPLSILKGLTYQEQLNFFFKKADFFRILKETSEYKTKLKKYKENELEKKEIKRKVSMTERKKIYKENQKKELENSKNRNYIVRKNIMAMLSLILPTKNYSTTTNTIDSLFMGNSSSLLSLSVLVSIFMNVFLGVEDKSEKYSHLTINGKVYTITNIIWLNDIYNHPEYKKLITEYSAFENFKYEELSKLEDEFDILIEKYIEKYKDQINEIKSGKFNNLSESGSYLDFRISSTYNLDSELKLLKENIGKGDYNSLLIVSRAFDNLKNNPLIRSISKLENLKTDTLILLTKSEIINYLNSPTIIADNKSKENEDKVSRLRTWSGYNEIQKFLTLVNELKSINSSNKLLQRELEKFENQNEEDNIDFINAMNPKNSRSLLHIVDSGISLNPTAQIYLRVDVIGGNIDDSNKSKIACIFSGESLGNDFEQLTKEKNFWELDKNRFFFDMDSETSTIINELKQSIKSSSTSNDSEKTLKEKIKGGKKRRTYRLKKNK